MTDDPEAYERELLAAMEEQRALLRSQKIDIEDIWIEGARPDSELVLTFRLRHPAADPNRVYGWRQPIWPRMEPTPEEEAFIGVAVQMMEATSGVARFPNHAPPGEIQWI